MKFIRRWAYACAKGLALQLNESHRQRGVYYYGFQIVIGSLVKVVSLIAISLLLGTLMPTLAILLAFVLLRIIAGGYHMDTYGKCIAASDTLFAIAGIISRYTYEYWTTWQAAILIGITFTLGSCVLYRWAPKDTPNKPITKPEKIKRLKTLSMVYMAAWLLIASALLYYNLRLYVLAASFGVLIELFTITPLGTGFFDFLSSFSLQKGPKVLK